MVSDRERIRGRERGSTRRHSCTYLPTITWLEPTQNPWWFSHPPSFLNSLYFFKLVWFICSKHRVMQYMAFTFETKQGNKNYTVCMCVCVCVFVCVCVCVCGCVCVCVCVCDVNNARPGPSGHEIVKGFLWLASLCSPSAASHNAKAHTLSLTHTHKIINHRHKD